MKICLLSIDFLPNIGGIAAHVYELSKALVKHGNEVHVITFREEFNGKKYEEIDGIEVHRIYRPKIKLIGSILYAFTAWCEIIFLIENEGIDIIHYHNAFDAFIAKFIPKISKVQTEHSSDFLEAVEKGKYKLYKWLLGHADHVIGPSQELVNTVIEMGVNQKKTSFISNGVDIEKFNPKIKGDKIREKYNIDTKEKVILCSRRLEPKNGVCYFIKSIPYILKQNSNLKCLIVGEGTEMDIIKNEVAKLRIFDKIVFAGKVQNSEMPKYYAASDIVVLPSLKEATSISGLEAMASGKVLIGTNVGGIPQIITNNETGLLVPSKNPEALAQAILSLLHDENKLIKMGLNARQKAEMMYSWDIIANQTENIYETLQKRRKIS